LRGARKEACTDEAHQIIGRRRAGSRKKKRVLGGDIAEGGRHNVRPSNPRGREKKGSGKKSEEMKPRMHIRGESRPDRRKKKEKKTVRGKKE